MLYNIIHLDCATKERSIPFEYLLHLLGQGSSSGSSSVLSGVYSWSNCGAEDRWSRQPITVDLQTLLETFLNMSLRSACFTDKASSGKQRKFQSWGYCSQVPDYQNLWMSDESNSENCLCRRAHTPQTLLTLRRLMSYIYGAPILDVSRSHTTTQHSR